MSAEKVKYGVKGGSWRSIGPVAFSPAVWECVADRPGLLSEIDRRVGDIVLPIARTQVEAMKSAGEKLREIRVPIGDQVGLLQIAIGSKKSASCTLRLDQDGVA